MSKRVELSQGKQYIRPRPAPPAGGARPGAGRPESLDPKICFTMRLSSATVTRVERFAKSRGLNRTQALETMIEEYALVLDKVILPGRWEPRTWQAGGLKTLHSRG